MIQSLTNEQMRLADKHTIQELGVPSLELMERAGTGITGKVCEVIKEKDYTTVLVVCGGGNNGGDGFVVARLLRERGIAVKVLCPAQKFSPDCLANKEKWQGELLTAIPQEKFDVIVDCVFGTGLSREVGGVELELIRFINKSGAYVLSADIPSGLNGDNGLVMGESVKADQTVSVQAFKNGLLLNDGVDHSGKISTVDIGIDTSIFDLECVHIAEDKDISSFFPPRKHNTHKGTYGKITILGGSTQYSGAPLLTAQAALRMGAGYTQLCVPKTLFHALIGRYPEVILTQIAGDDHLELNEENLTELLSADCITMGMGCGVSHDLYEIITFLLRNYSGKLLLDADALNTLAKYGTGVLKEKKCRVLLTPHLKEFSRLSGESMASIKQNGVALAGAFAREYGVTVLLKSAVSIITDGERIYFNTKGDPCLAKGGSGDVLSGVIGSIAAQGHSMIDSALCGSYLFGKAASLCAEQMGSYSVIGSDVISMLPSAILSVGKQS